MLTRTYIYVFNIKLQKYTVMLKRLGYKIRIRLNLYNLTGLGQERVWQIFLIFCAFNFIIK
jgi:hypothetical protein